MQPEKILIGSVRTTNLPYGRPVKIKVNSAGFNVGIFHCWLIRGDNEDGNLRLEPIAMIELPDGSVKEMYSTWFQFSDVVNE